MVFSPLSFAFYALYKTIILLYFINFCRVNKSVLGIEVEIVNSFTKPCVPLTHFSTCCTPFYLFVPPTGVRQAVPPDPPVVLATRVTACPANPPKVFYSRSEYKLCWHKLESWERWRGGTGVPSLYTLRVYKLGQRQSV
jgi:hypothetical protein